MTTARNQENTKKQPYRNREFHLRFRAFEFSCFRDSPKITRTGGSRKHETKRPRKNHHTGTESSTCVFVLSSFRAFVIFRVVSFCFAFSKPWICPKTPVGQFSRPGRITPAWAVPQ